MQVVTSNQISCYSYCTAEECQTPALTVVSNHRLMFQILKSVYLVQRFHLTGRLVTTNCVITFVT